MADPGRRFGAFILSHGRSNKMLTLRALERAGYTGPVWILCDDEDETIDEYFKRFGEKVIVFDKKAQADKDDAFDNSGDRRSILHARNYCWEAARMLGLTHFIQLDDDYNQFGWVTDNEGQYITNKDMGAAWIGKLDEVLSALCDFLDETEVLTVAMAQGGDLIGGAEGGMVEMARAWRFKRKAMNSFVCRTDRVVRFAGRINEDVNAYVVEGLRGKLLLTVPRLRIYQQATQSRSGGLTEMYLNKGTYIKSFFTVMAAPGCVEVRIMGPKNKRMHHHILWAHTSPMLVSEDLPPASLLGLEHEADGLGEDPSGQWNPGLPGDRRGDRAGEGTDSGPVSGQWREEEGEGEQCEEACPNESGRDPKKGEGLSVNKTQQVRASI